MSEPSIAETISAVVRPKDVYRPAGPPAPYVLWYIPQFPLDRLKFTPLEDTQGETPRRLMLAEDIEKRGLLNPLLIWNHTCSGARESPRPYYLKIGYNKLWALKHLGRTHAPAFLSLDVGRAPDFPCQGCYSPDAWKQHYREGTLVLGHEGPTFKDCSRLDYWELPA